MTPRPLSSCQYGIEAVISHVGPEGKEQLIAFASQTMSPSERNYSQIEKEALALIYGVKYFTMPVPVQVQVHVFDGSQASSSSPGSKDWNPNSGGCRLLAAYLYEIEFQPTRE